MNIPVIIWFTLQIFTLLRRFRIFNVAHRGRKYGTTTMIGMGHTKNLQLQSNPHNGVKDNERNKKKLKCSR